MRRAAVIGAGSWGTAVAVLLARGGLDVQLGTRTGEQAAEINAARENARYLPGVELPGSLRVRQSGEDRARRNRPRLPRDPLQLTAAGGRARSPTGSAIGPRSCS